MQKYVKMWKDNYAKPGYPDQRAIGDFIECESGEVLRFFRNELIGISKGNYTDQTMDAIVGRSRIARHGSYSEWATLMLQWIASYNK